MKLYTFNSPLAANINALKIDFGAILILKSTISLKNV